MEELTMAFRSFNLARCFGLLAAVLYVGWGLYTVQLRGYYGGADYYWFDPFTSCTYTKYGWPNYFMTSTETAAVVRSRSVQHTSHEVGCCALVADAASWLAMIFATGYISRRALWSGWRFSLASLFAVTTAVAIMLAWWRVERAQWHVMPLLQDDVGSPLLRLLDFSSFVYVPVLFGASCLVMFVILTGTAAARLAVRKTRRKAPIAC
jgi:hypothetical protein